MSILRRSFFSSLAAYLPTAALMKAERKPRFAGWCDCSLCKEDRADEIDKPYEQRTPSPHGLRADSEETWRAYIEGTARVFVNGEDVTGVAMGIVNEADGFVDCACKENGLFVHVREKANAWPHDGDYYGSGYHLVKRVRGHVEIRISQKQA